MNKAELKTVVAAEIIKRNLNEKEASAEYGCSVHWYRRARTYGGGPKFIKLAGSVLYPRTELDAFFDARLVKSTSESSIREVVIHG